MKKTSTYYVVINNIEIEVPREVYSDLNNDRIYRITYLPNSRITIKVE